MREFGKIMAAFAGGALVGAVVALLTAPKSGAETTPSGTLLSPK